MTSLQGKTTISKYEEREINDPKDCSKLCSSSTFSFSFYWIKGCLKLSFQSVFASRILILEKSNLLCISRVSKVNGFYLRAIAACNFCVISHITRTVERHFTKFLATD